MLLNLDVFKEIEPQRGMNLGPDINMTELSCWVRTYAMTRGVRAVVIPGRNSRYYGWQCANPDCTWRISISKRKASGDWVVSRVDNIDHTGCTEANSSTSGKAIEPLIHRILEADPDASYKEIFAIVSKSSGGVCPPESTTRDVVQRVKQQRENASIGVNDR